MANRENLNKGLMNILSNKPVAKSESQNIKLEDLTTFVDRDGNANPSIVDEKDPEFIALVENIKTRGLDNPIIVRKDPASPDKFQILCGHHRVAAYKQIGEYDSIKAYVRDISDDEAAILVATDNFNRKKNYKPSEKGFAFKMALDAMKRQGQRTDLTSGQNGPKLNDAFEPGSRSNEELAMIVGESVKNIQRYIRITYLIPELRTVVDSKRLKLVPAVELSYLEEKNQKLVYDTVFDNPYHNSLNIDQAGRIRAKADTGFPLSESIIAAIANDIDSKGKKLKLTGKIKNLLPKEAKLDDEQMELYIIKAILAYQELEPAAEITEKGADE
ncbi:MAG: ParB N-terminal domain-containing protein [Saccharofermentans sp.]|nr:ParB N-terminal domain-containing protein [Saccharofermentans sp.]